VARRCLPAMAASSAASFSVFEAGEALADGGFAETFSHPEGGNVSGDVLALVHELGIGLDEADELLAGHLLLAGLLLGKAAMRAMM